MASKIREAFSSIRYFIAYIILYAGALNDGMTKYYLSIPFLVYLLYKTGALLRTKKYVYFILNILLIGLAVFVALVDRSGSSVVYPIIGEKIVFKKDCFMSRNKYYPFKFSFSTGKTPYPIKKGDSFTIERVIVVGHPEFVTNCIYQVRTNIEAVKRFIDDAKSINIHYEDISPAYVSLDKNKTYTTKYAFHEAADLILFSTERHLYNYNRFELLSALLIFIFYIPVLLLFFIFS